VSQFMIQNVLVPFVKLREKYEGSIAADMKEHQLKEYQLQVLLRTEIATLAKSDEKSSLVQEVCSVQLHVEWEIVKEMFSVFYFFPSFFYVLVVVAFGGLDW